MADFLEYLDALLAARCGVHDEEFGFYVTDRTSLRRHLEVAGRSRSGDPPPE
jgi:hypothetical protein